jgi:hypothetical protein
MKHVYFFIALMAYSTFSYSQSFTSDVDVTKNYPILSITNLSSVANSFSALEFSSNELNSENFYRFLSQKNLAGNGGELNFAFRKQNTTTNTGFLTFLLFNDANNDIKFNTSNTFTANENYGNILFENGKVGIGILNPSEILDIVGSTKIGHTKAEAIIFNYAGAPTVGYQSIGSNSNGDLVLSSVSTISGNEHLVIQQLTGNVGIGTTTMGSHKLAVEGSIGAREIKVEASGWSDFVFENNYKLRTLEEVEKYINENKHLPEIPSEIDVVENGFYLGEMNAKLLQKIEELTLYLIEENKENNRQQKLIEELQNEVRALKNE